MAKDCVDAARDAGKKIGLQVIGRHVNVVAFAGDGASVDAGMQRLSGAAERGDKLIYICYDNEGYMNTGTSAAAPPPRGPGSPPPLPDRLGLHLR